MNSLIPNSDSTNEREVQPKALAETFMVMNFEAYNNPNYYAFLLRRYTGHELSDRLSALARFIGEQKFTADHARSIRERATKVTPTPITDYDDTTHHYGALVGMRIIETLAGVKDFERVSASLSAIVEESKETSEKYRSDLRPEAFVNSLLGTALTDSQPMYAYSTLIEAPTIKATIHPGKQSEAEDGIGLVLAAFLRT